MKDELMVQQQVKTVWKHMVGVICLNLTYRKQVKEVLPKLFKRYPNPKSFLRGSSKVQARMLEPLGMVNVRLHRLKQMSIDMLTWDYKDAKKLYGIGKYAKDSWEIFQNNNMNVKPKDKVLQEYLRVEG